MPNVHHTGTCDVPLDVVWNYLADFANIPEWLSGATRMQHLGGPAGGVGGMWKGTFQVPPVKFSSDIEITTWVDRETIAYESRSGFSNQMTYRITPLAPERTRIVVDLDYRIPGGLAGRALGKALAPIFAMTVDRADAALRAKLEQLYRERIDS